MKQQCHVSMIYCSWAVYLGGMAVLAWRSEWAFAAAWLVCAPLFQWIYIRKFPDLSSLMGYGEVTDEKARDKMAASTKVTLYTALGCPFCPLIEERLEELRKRMHFPLEKIDVTLRPDLLAAKGIRSVPVVEIDGRLLFGLVTSKELCEAIAEATLQPSRM